MSTRKRVLLLRSSIGVFGAEQMIFELAGGLAHSDFEPVIGVIQNKNPSSVKMYEAARQRDLEAKMFACRLPFDPITVAALARFVNRNKIDIIHAHGYKANFYAITTALLTGVPCMATCHPWTETDYSLRARLYTFLDKMWLRRMDQLTAVSEGVREQLRQRLPQVECSVIPNGIDVSRFNGSENSAIQRSDLGLLPEHLVIGTIGRLVPEKGYNFLLESASKLVEKYPDMRFVFIGDGPLREELKTQAQNLGLSDQVRFLGIRCDIPQLLKMFNIFILPSISEGLPMVILEAMAAAKPVIATRVGDIPTVITDKKSGLLVDAGEPEALETAVKVLIENRLFASDIALTGRNEIYQRFSSGAMTRRYIR